MLRVMALNDSPAKACRIRLAYQHHTLINIHFLSKKILHWSSHKGNVKTVGKPDSNKVSKAITKIWNKPINYNTQATGIYCGNHYDNGLHSTILLHAVQLCFPKNNIIIQCMDFMHSWMSNSNGTVEVVMCIGYQNLMK